MIPLLIAGAAAAYFFLKNKNSNSDYNTTSADEERQNRAAALGTSIQGSWGLARPKTPTPTVPKGSTSPISSRPQIRPLNQQRRVK